MDLVRDCLDKQLKDRNGKRMGRVDDIVLEIGEDRAPRIVAIEIGAVAQARRVHPRLGAWMARRARKWAPSRSDPYRIAWQELKVTRNEVTVDIAAGRTRAMVWERWLRRRVIGRIPGA